MSTGTELIHWTGRHTNKASASSTCFSGLLWVFVRQPGFDHSTLHGHQHLHRHLVECGFQWGWFYIESAFITALEMTQLFWKGCAKRPWKSSREGCGPPTGCWDPLPTFGSVSESAGGAAEIPGGPRPKMLCEMAHR